MKKCFKCTTSAELSRKHAVAGEYRKIAQCHFCAIHPKGWSCLLLRIKAWNPHSAPRPEPWRGNTSPFILPTTMPKQEKQWNRILWVTALFCKAATGSLLKIHSSWWDLSMSLSGHFIRELTYFIRDQTKGIVGKFCNKNSIKYRAWIQQTALDCKSVEPTDLLSFTRVCLNCVTGWKPQLRSSHRPGSSTGAQTPTDVLTGCSPWVIN